MIWWRPKQWRYNKATDFLLSSKTGLFDFCGNREGICSCCEGIVLCVGYYWIVYDSAEHTTQGYYNPKAERIIISYKEEGKAFEEFYHVGASIIRQIKMILSGA